MSQQYQEKINSRIMVYQEEIAQLERVLSFSGSLPLALGIFILTCVSVISPFVHVHESLFLASIMSIMAVFLFAPVVASRKISLLRNRIYKLQTRLDRIVCIAS